MTLAEIRSLIREYIGDPDGQIWTDTRLTTVVARAVEHVVNIVEQTAKMYNVCSTPITVLVVAGTQSYQISSVSPSVAIRKILLVERTDLNSTKPMDCVIIDMRHKNRFNWDHSCSDGLTLPGNRPVVYFTRSPNPNAQAADWYLNFPYDPRSSMTLQVYYAPQVTPMNSSSDVPNDVPENHHELIAVRAAITCLMEERRDTSDWRAEYANLRQMLEVDLHRWNKTGPWVRQFFASHV